MTPESLHKNRYISRVLQELYQNRPVYKDHPYKYDQVVSNKRSSGKHKNEWHELNAQFANHH